MKNVSQTSKMFIADGCAGLVFFAFAALIQFVLDGTWFFRLGIAVCFILIAASKVLQRKLRFDVFDELAAQHSHAAFIATWEIMNDLLLLCMIFAGIIEKPVWLQNINPAVPFVLLLGCQHLLLAFYFAWYERKNNDYVENDD